MNPDTTLSISLICLLLTTVIGIANFYYSRKKDTSSDLEGVIKMNVKLDQICSTTNETRSDIKSIRNEMKDITEEQIIQRQEIKAIWNRIDELKNEIHTKGGI